MKTFNYIITRASYTAEGTRLEQVDLYEIDDLSQIKNSEVISRDKLYLFLQSGYTIFTGGFTEKDTWFSTNQVHLYTNGTDNSISIDNFYIPGDALGRLPKLLPRHKSFVSFHHKYDEHYCKQFENLTQDLLSFKSFALVDINTDLSTEYINQLHQKEYLSDTTVLVVLVGPTTRVLKQVDWEIACALDTKVDNNYAGVIGILLPTHPDYPQEKIAYNNLPARLADNFKTDYAVMLDWTTDRVTLQKHIEQAFERRSSKASLRSNSRMQMA